MTTRPLRLALVMDLTLGWRTNYQNWKQNFPQDLNVQPHWIVLSGDKPHWIDTLPGLPKRLKNRLRASLLLRGGLGQGPFDAAFFATSAALTALPRYSRQFPCFLYVDATPKQLYAFGDFYGWHPSENPRVEQWKHRKRADAYQKARGVFTMSQWAADSAVADYGVKPENTHVLPPGVDITQWQPGDLAQKSAKGVCDLLFVGGDFGRKGGPSLLKWASETRQTGWRLHLVTRQAVETADPRICVYNDLTANDPRLQALYAQADVFVLPTLADCSSWAGIEALASGLPLLITATGGTGEIVQAGKTGYVLDADRSSSLAEALETVIADPALRRRMGQAARRDAEQRYSAAALVREAVQMMKSKI